MPSDLFANFAIREGMEHSAIEPGSFKSIPKFRSRFVGYHREYFLTNGFEIYSPISRHLINTSIENLLPLVVQLKSEAIELCF
ncbi:hypothetical protein CVN56_30005 [Rhodococcus sp. AQ5-07]|nr:hypothetical protein CVN56_30005 [Rhodococcus sp. AQ5-07]